MNHFKQLCIFLIFIELFLITSCSTSEKKVKQDDSVFYQTGVVIDNDNHQSYYSNVINPLYKFYSNFISPIDNRQCIFTPTCSNYSKEAIQKYGIFKGFILTFARLIRCNPSVFINNRYPHSKENDIWKASDPVQ